MATIINNPDTSSGNGAAVGVIVGILAVVVIAILFFAYALPALRRSSNTTNINVPDRINVNTNGAGGSSGGTGGGTGGNGY